MIKPKKSVENMSGYFVPLFEKERDVKIDSNENNYGPSSKVIEALRNCDYKNISFYPFYGELSQKIADYQNVQIDNIKVTNGADEALQAIVQTYLEKDEALLTLDISFAMPEIYTEIQGGRVIKVPFEKQWEFPTDNFIKNLSNPEVKIVYLASPNNPTGNVIKECDLAKILENSRNKVVIIDETYANYSGLTYKDFVKVYDNLFVVKSFSKDFALAGMRLGYIISNSANIENLKKVVSPFSVNSFAMRAGIAALSDVEYFKNVRSLIVKSRAELKTFFESLGAFVYESEANFLLVNFGEKAEFVYKKLLQENIVVKLFAKGGKLENHLRVTIPTDYGVTRIKQALSNKISLVFDMDGVLVDARNSYRAAIQKTYEKYTGKTVTPEEIQSVKNLGGMNNDWDLTEYLLKKDGLNIPYAEIVQSFQKIYWADGTGLINNETPLFKRKLFEKLSKNYNLSIFTGRLYNEANFALKKFNSSELFTTLVTTDDIPEGKGKPDPYGLNMTKGKTISEKYFYFGDTIDDVKAAKAAGYIAVGVLPPQDKSEELADALKKNGADFVLKSINDIEMVLEQKNEAVC